MALRFIHPFHFRFFFSLSFFSRFCVRFYSLCVFLMPRTSTLRRFYFYLPYSPSLCVHPFPRFPSLPAPLSPAPPAPSILPPTPPLPTLSPAPLFGCLCYSSALLPLPSSCTPFTGLFHNPPSPHNPAHRPSTGGRYGPIENEGMTPIIKENGRRDV